MGFSRSPAVRGERAAATFLRQHGYRILARNLRNRFGEIDILAQASDRRTIVIVEVKSAALAPGERAAAVPPELHVNTAKQRKLTALAMQLVRDYRLGDVPIRFDVVAVELPPRGAPIIRHHPAAFEATF